MGVDPTGTHTAGYVCGCAMKNFFWVRGWCGFDVQNTSRSETGVGALMVQRVSRVCGWVVGGNVGSTSTNSAGVRWV